MEAKKKVKEIEKPEKYVFANYDELKREYLSDKMVDRKVVAFKNKLIELHREDRLDDDASELMETILNDLENKGKINQADLDYRNKIVYDRLENKAIVKTDYPPTVHHLKKDLVCRWFYDRTYNDMKGKKDSIGRYHVYVPVTIPTEHQISVEIARRELKNHTVPLDQYPPPRVVIHKIVLKSTEFKAWFDIDENLLEKDTKAEEKFQTEYNF